MSKPKKYAKNAAKKTGAEEQPLEDRLTREANDAARAEGAKHGAVEAVERTGYNVAAGQIAVSIRVTMKDATGRNYEYRCDAKGNHCKLL